jgi:hypothetical protein
MVAIPVMAMVAIPVMVVLAMAVAMAAIQAPMVLLVMPPRRLHPHNQPHQPVASNLTLPEIQTSPHRDASARLYLTNQLIYISKPSRSGLKMRFPINSSMIIFCSHPVSSMTMTQVYVGQLYAE